MHASGDGELVFSSQISRLPYLTSGYVHANQDPEHRDKDRETLRGDHADSSRLIWRAEELIDEVFQVRITYCPAVVCGSVCMKLTWCSNKSVVL